MSLSDDMKKIIDDDIKEIVSMLSMDGIDASLVSLEISPSDIQDEIKQTVKAKLKIDQELQEVSFCYDIKLDAASIYIDKPCEDIAIEIEKTLHTFMESTNIQGKTYIQSAAVIAADDDFESDDFSDESGSDEPNEIEQPKEQYDSLSENIDDIAETVDDIKGRIDKIDEDDVNIEIENNISDHYIAECERCHGIFISSVTRSEQPLEKISGTCPLCDRQTDQYLKWVVKDVKDIEE